MNDTGETQEFGDTDQDGSPRVGALLRASRTRVGENLRDISDILCIRYLYLEAIEDCRYQDLPGETYAIGFIRSYAEHLGLDGEEVVRRFRAEQAGTKRANELAFPTPMPESGVPKGAIVFVGVIMALVVYGGWYVTTTDEDFFAELIAPVPDRLKHLVEDAPQTERTEPIYEAQTNSPSEARATPVETLEPEPVVEQSSESAATVEEVPANRTEPEADTSATTAESEQPVTEPEQEQASESAVAAGEDSGATGEPNTEAPPEAAVDLSDTTVDEPVEVSEQPDGAIDTPAVDQALAETADIPATQENPAPEQGVPAVQADAEGVEAPDAGAADAPSADTVTTETPEQNVSNEPAAQVEAEPSVTAEDLNIQSLRDATGQSEEAETNEEAQVETLAEQVSVEEETAEVAGVPGTETLNAEGAISEDGVAILAVSDSWVEITDPQNGSILFTGVMRAGVSFDVPERGGLLLDTGNAGGLDFYVDGQLVPKVGGDGTVRKGVALDPARLRSGTATEQ